VEKLVRNAHLGERYFWMSLLIEGRTGDDLFDSVPAEARPTRGRCLCLHQLTLVAPDRDEIDPIVSVCRRLIAAIPALCPQHVCKPLEELPVHLKSNIERSAFIHIRLAVSENYP